MPYRITPLANNEYYHIYNRGVARQPTYFFKNDYERFLLSLSYYRFDNLPSKLSRLLQIPKDEREQIFSELEQTNDKVIDIICYCLMPNHFHLLVQQLKDGGISKFMKQTTDSYTRYFNTKHQRVGPIFQGAFKSVHVDSNEQLLHLSRYIHLNPLVSFVVREDGFLDYPWSSLKKLVNDDLSFVNAKVVIKQFKSPEKYLKFVLDQTDYAKELEHIKHLSFE